MSERDPQRPRRRAYCLRCFATLQLDSNLCGDCDYVSTPSMRALFWSQVPWMCAVERWVKIAGALLAIPMAVWLAFQARATGGGYIVGLPVMAYAGVCMTVGKLTRNSPQFRPGVFWTSAFAIAAVVPIVLSYLAVLGPAAFLQALALSGLFVLASLSSWRLARRADQWKRRLIAGPTDT